ncbi:MAG TPA: ATP-grasp fold amidoligase family protein [Propionibacteriaceae bacterium]
MRAPRGLHRRLAIGAKRRRIDELDAEVARLTKELGAARQKVSDYSETRNQLTYHRDTLRRTRARLEGPSFHRELQSLKNYGFAMADVDPSSLHPMRQLSHKLRIYQFAASHGVATPRILGTWPSPSAITFDELPDRFVLKADGGAASQGVLPLQRRSSGVFATVDGSRTLTTSEIVDVFARASRAKKVWGIFFAEEFLEQPGGSAIPDDVKIYVAYGRVLQVLLRRVGEHGKDSTVRYKYVSAAGRDLGAITTTRDIDPAIPVPNTLGDMVSIARHLSRAIGLPFCRVDLYNTIRGVVLGEITRTPGGAQTYQLDHDRWMGEQWLLAKAELELDTLRGRPVAMLYGPNPAPNPYPADHPLRGESARSRRVHTDCAAGVPTMRAAPATGTSE